MKRTVGMAMVLLSVMGLVSSKAWGHCQIPCGIYDDPARFGMLEEHLTTIEKSMQQIIVLGKEHDITGGNQLVRWVMNKEEHADAFSEIVTYYFLTQRIKPAEPSDKAAYEKYVREVTLLHQMMVHAMKAKQTVDLDEVEQLRALLKAFRTSYMAGK